MILIICYCYESYAQFPKTIDLSQASADVTVYGVKPLDQTGYLVTSGDIDGNGVTDLIITTKNAEPFGKDGSLEIEILWGNTAFNSIIDLYDFQGDISRILGDYDDAGSNSSLCCGDFNNDGHDDIVIGVPLSADGHAHMIFGGPDFPDTLDLASTMDGVTRIAGVQYEGASLGWACASGDINNDSYDDLIVSAIGFDWSPDEVYIIYGRDVFPENINMTINPSNATRIIDSEQDQATGKGLFCKDFDRDGYDDIFIGCPGNLVGYQAGKGILLYGTPDLPDTVMLSDPSFRKIILYPEYSNGFLGDMLAIGDVNHDDQEDLIISAYGGDPLGCNSCGIVYLVFGNNTLPDSIHVGSLDIPIARMVGAGDDERYGLSMTCADFSGDGYEDIAIGSKPNPDDASDVYKITILYGQQSLPDSVFLASDTTLTRILGETSSDYFGRGLGVGDFDNNDVQDLLIGARYASPLGRNKAGKAYLLYGIRDPSGIRHDQAPIFSMLQNYPNPFSSNTTVEYFVANPSRATFTVYNIIGQRVTQMINPHTAIGANTFTWNGLDENGEQVASGLYLYRVEIGGVTQTRKLTLVR